MRKEYTHTANTIKMINLPKIWDTRGNLSFIELGNPIDFNIKRVFYLYDVPRGGERGGHALKTCSQLLIAISGSFSVKTITQDKKRGAFTLKKPDEALLLDPMVWRELYDFSASAVCLVLASEEYQAESYYRDIIDFLNA